MPSPPRQLHADLGGDPLNNQHQNDQSQENRTHLVPAVGAHGENQRRANTSGTHQAQNRGVPQIHIEAVNQGGHEVGKQLGQDAVANFLERRAARRVQGLQNPLVQVLNALNKHLGNHADGAQGHGQKTRKGPRPCDTDEHQAINKGGNGADGRNGEAP